MKSEATGIKRLLRALGYSISGLKAAFVHEAAFRQALFLAAVLIPTMFYLDLNAHSRALLIASLFLVIIVELLNAAIEAVVDKVSPEWHELAKRAKDIASAAVLVALTNLAITWALVVWG